MSNYIDLGNRIIKDSGTISTNVMAGIDETLDWLDEHPDEAPGRTITQSEYRDTLNHAVKVSGYGDDWERGFCTGLTVGGTKVVPDPDPEPEPDPEDALKLANALAAAAFDKPWESFDDLARQALKRGVKAPGGDDE